MQINGPMEYSVNLKRGGGHLAICLPCAVATFPAFNPNKYRNIAQI